MGGPQQAPKPKAQVVGTTKPKLTRVRAALLSLLRLYQVEGYHHSLLELQKLAYFLQLAGESMRLRFVKDKYGPYSETLNHVIQNLEGHYLRGYGDRSQAAEIKLLPGASQEAESFLAGTPALENVKRVAELIEGFESPHGLELLATVHWVMHDMPMAAVIEDVAVSGVHAWNARKKKLFSDRHVKLARTRLLEHDWIRSELIPNEGN